MKMKMIDSIGDIKPKGEAMKIDSYSIDDIKPKGEAMKMKMIAIRLMISSPRVKL